MGIMGSPALIGAVLTFGAIASSVVFLTFTSRRRLHGDDR